MDGWERLALEAAERAAAVDFHGQVLVRVGGENRLAECFGLAERTHGAAVTPDTRFGVASFSKMFTAATVASLVAEGRVVFEDAVRRLLPRDVDLPWLRDDVTLGHLLSHTSGIPDYLREDELAEGDADIFTPVLGGRPVYGLREPRDFLPLMRHLAVDAETPPRPFAYSSTGFVLAGLAVEQLIGRAFPDAVAGRVLAPLGLAGTGYPAVESLEPDLATGYVEIGGGLGSNVFLLPPVGGPDGGAFSTAADLAAFLEAYDRDEVVPGLRDVLLAPRAEVEDDVHYGYGAYTVGDPADPHFRFGHSGFDPGFECWAFRWPGLDATVALTSNVNHAIVAVRDVVVAAVERLAGR